MDMKTDHLSTETARENEKTGTALLDLAERCEAAMEPDREIDLRIEAAVNSEYAGLEDDQARWLTRYGGHPRYTASVDAALRLVPAGMEAALDPHFMDEDGVVRHKGYCFKPDWSRWSPHGDWVEKVAESKVAASRALAICAAALRVRALPLIETRSAET